VSSGKKNEIWPEIKTGKIGGCWVVSIFYSFYSFITIIQHFPTIYKFLLKLYLLIGVLVRLTFEGV